MTLLYRRPWGGKAAAWQDLSSRSGPKRKTSSTRCLRKSRVFCVWLWTCCRILGRCIVCEHTYRWEKCELIGETCHRSPQNTDRDWPLKWEMSHWYLYEKLLFWWLTAEYLVTFLIRLLFGTTEHLKRSWCIQLCEMHGKLPAVHTSWWPDWINFTKPQSVRPRFALNKLDLRWIPKWHRWFLSPHVIARARNSNRLANTEYIT